MAWFPGRWHRGLRTCKVNRKRVLKHDTQQETALAASARRFRSPVHSPRLTKLEPPL